MDQITKIQEETNILNDFHSLKKDLVDSEPFYNEINILNSKNHALKLKIRHLENSLKSGQNSLKNSSKDSESTVVVTKKKIIDSETENMELQHPENQNSRNLTTSKFCNSFTQTYEI